jgi:serine phosphatase RsbU (regulator of sigma subunit)
LLHENDEVGICDLLFVFHLGVPELNVTPPPARRSGPATEAMMVDEDGDDQSESGMVMSKLNIPSKSSGMRLEVNTEAKLKAVLEISQNLSKALSLAEVLPKLLDSLFTIFIQADRGFIVLRDPQTGKLVPKAVKHRNPLEAPAIRISSTIVNSVMASKEAILSADAAADSRFDMSQSIVDFHIRSMMCVPLIGREGSPMGVIQIDALDPRNRFRQDDLDVLVSVACQAAFAVENAQLYESAMRDQALKRELAVAHEVQRGFLPAVSPKIEGYEFFEFYESAHEVGGDYYDYIDLPGGRLAVVMADVSGKGISASLLMAKLSSETRYCLASEPTPAQAIARLNREFCESGWEDRFVTLAVAVLDPWRHEVTIVNAGHPQPLLRRGAGVVEPVAETQTRLPLGVDPNVEYAQCKLPLAPGESLTLFTDGITEAMNTDDELYGVDRLLAQLNGDVNSIRQLGRCILNDVKRFVGARSQSDDMCLTCFGRLPEPTTAAMDPSSGKSE